MAVTTVVVAGVAMTLHLLGVSMERVTVATIVTLCLWCWATGWVSDFLTSLLLLFLLAAFARLEPAAVFAGFTSSAFWLVFSGAVIGMALADTGLCDRAAARLTVHCGRSYPTALAGFVLIALVLSVIMPSTLGRIAILMPVVLSFADRVGLVSGRPGRAGVVLATSLASCELSSAILPANLPNLVMIGSAETILNFHISYLDYAALFGPSLVIMRGALIVGVGLLLFPDDLRAVRETESPQLPMSNAETKLLAVIVLMLTIWLAEAWHGLAPGWVALGAAIVCIGPARLVLTEQFLDRVKIQPLWFVAAIIGLTNAVDSVGFVEELKPWLQRFDFSAMSPFGSYLVLVALSSLLTFAFTSNAAPALYTPLVPQLVASGALNIKSALLVQVVGFSTIFLPYQAPPLVLATSLTGISGRESARYCIAVAALSLPTVVPLNFLWWRALGLL